MHKTYVLRLYKYYLKLGHYYFPTIYYFTYHLGHLLIEWTQVFCQSDLYLICKDWTILTFFVIFCLNTHKVLYYHEFAIHLFFALLSTNIKQVTEKIEKTNVFMLHLFWSSCQTDREDQLDADVVLMMMLIIWAKRLSMKRNKGVW